MAAHGPIVPRTELPPPSPACKDGIHSMPMLEHCRGLYKADRSPPCQCCHHSDTKYQASEPPLPASLSSSLAKHRFHLVMSILGLILALLWLFLGPTFSVELSLTGSVGTTDHLAHTLAGLKTLEQWYNPDTGLWGGWWTSANQLTTVADFAYMNPGFRPTVLGLFQNTFTKAPGHKTGQIKVNNATTVDTYYWPNIPVSLGIPPSESNGDWLNWFYDDEGWWALGWLKVYDVTNDTAYLNTAMAIFDDMFKGWGATCGGIWWNKAHEANVAISNELFLAVAAQLANRAQTKAAKSFYLDWALKQWMWFSNSGLINADHNINDGLDLKTCKNNGGLVWSYNAGAIIGGLIELNKAQPDEQLLVTAQSIAMAAIKKLSDSNGILHDVCEPDCGNDGPQFKGIFMRNLQVLQQAMPNAKFGDFIQKNADSIWINARGPGDKLDLVWSGLYKSATASTQSSALDALVAAVALAKNSSRDSIL